MHGLPASSEVVATAIELAARRAGAVDAADVARLVDALAGSRIEVGDASRYLIRYARQQGYDIPAYAFAGCGEIKQFFRDQGVRDVPGWYEKIGVPSGDVDRLYGRTMVVTRDFEHRRMAILLHGRYHDDRGRFLPLGESGLVEHLGGEPRVGGGHIEPEPGESLDDILRQVLAFLVRGDTGGRPIF